MNIYEEHEVRAMLAEKLKEHGVVSWARSHGFARTSGVYLSRLARGLGSQNPGCRPYTYQITDRVLRALKLRRVYIAIDEEQMDESRKD